MRVLLSTLCRFFGLCNGRSHEVLLRLGRIEPHPRDALCSKLDLAAQLLVLEHSTDCGVCLLGGASPYAALIRLCSASQVIGSSVSASDTIAATVGILLHAGCASAHPGPRAARRQYGCLWRRWSSASHNHKTRLDSTQSISRLDDSTLLVPLVVPIFYVHCLLAGCDGISEK